MLYTLIEIVRIDQKPKKKLSRMVEGGGVGRHSVIVYCEGESGGQCYQISGWPSVPSGDVPNPKWWLIRMENNEKMESICPTKTKLPRF